jgi:hypothetical protein
MYKCVAKLCVVLGISVGVDFVCVLDTFCPQVVLGLSTGNFSWNALISL